MCKLFCVKQQLWRVNKKKSPETSWKWEPTLNSSQSFVAHVRPYQYRQYRFWENVFFFTSWQNLLTLCWRPYLQHHRSQLCCLMRKSWEFVDSIVQDNEGHWKQTSGTQTAQYPLLSSHNFEAKDAKKLQASLLNNHVTHPFMWKCKELVKTKSRFWKETSLCPKKRNHVFSQWNTKWTANVGLGDVIYALCLPCIFCIIYTFEFHDLDSTRTPFWLNLNCLKVLSPKMSIKN